MKNAEKIQRRISLSGYDMETADAILQTKRYLYVGFMYYQVVKNFFKACYVKLKEDTPPYTHNLEYLALKSGFYEILSEKQQDFILELNPLNTEARYSKYKFLMCRSVPLQRTGCQKKRLQILISSFWQQLKNNKINLYINTI